MSIQKNELRIAQIAKSHIDGLDVLDVDFSTFLKGLPVMIGQNGLLQTLAFIRGKEHSNNSDSNQRVESKYTKLKESIDDFSHEFFGLEGSFFDHLTRLDNIQQYIQYQRTILIYTEWLKRFAAAFSSGGQG